MSNFWDKKNGNYGMSVHLLLVNNQRIPPVELDESFKYLGKEFNYKMSTQHKEKDLTDELSKYLTKLDSVLLHQGRKLQ